MLERRPVPDRLRVPSRRTGRDVLGDGRTCPRGLSRVSFWVPAAGKPDGVNADSTHTKIEGAIDLAFSRLDDRMGPLLKESRRSPLTTSTSRTGRHLIGSIPSSGIHPAQTKRQGTIYQAVYKRLLFEPRCSRCCSVFSVKNPVSLSERNVHRSKGLELRHSARGVRNSLDT